MKLVTRLPKSRYNSNVKIRPASKKHIALGLFLWSLIILALFLTVLLPPLVLTRMGVSSFLSGNFDVAAKRWQQARLIVDPLSSLTQPLVTDGVLWQASLSLAEQLANDLHSFNQQKQQSIYDLPTDVLVSHIPNYLLMLDSIEANFESSIFVKQVFKQKKVLEKISLIKEWLGAVSPVLSNKSKWIILLQNDNELRATGGFMGSYAVITINQGKITELTIEDIYDADGQFSGYFPAPVGVKEYLSSGNGLRLPDANWHPDFPTSAQQVLGYFALGNRSEISGVIAVTNSVIGEVLKITGPLQLPDYHTNITPDTLDAVLQNRPQAFFPGSIQKKHMLSQAKNQLVAAVTKFTLNDWLSLLAILNNEIHTKNILFFSVNDSLNSLFDTYSMSGKLATQSNNQDLLALIESNVGINKSNQWQHRSVTVDVSKPTQAIITLQYSNQSPESITFEQSRYVNYLRLITDVNWILESVQEDNNNPATEWQQTPLLTKTGNQFSETGGLLEVAPRSTKVVTITFKRESSQAASLLLVKQPGLPEVHYTIIKPDGSSEQLVVESNQEFFITK